MLFKSEKLPALTMIDNLCCSFFVEHCTVVALAMTGCKISLTGTHSSVISSEIKRLRCVLQVLRMPKAGWNRYLIYIRHNRRAQNSAQN